MHGRIVLNGGFAGRVFCGFLVRKVSCSVVLLPSIWIFRIDDDVMAHVFTRQPRETVVELKEVWKLSVQLKNCETVNQKDLRIQNFKILHFLQILYFYASYVSEIGYRQHYKFTQLIKKGFFFIVAYIFYTASQVLYKFCANRTADIVTLRRNLDVVMKPIGTEL